VIVIAAVGYILVIHENVVTQTVVSVQTQTQQNCACSVTILLELVGTVLVAVLSGYFLLRSHHAKARAELFYPRKQEAYDEILNVVNGAFDQSQGLDELNWRKVRAAQTLYLLAGSQEVVDLFNAIMKTALKQATTEEEMKKDDLEITRLRKELWNAMRKDLYHAAPLRSEAVKFVGPGRRTIQAVELWGKNRMLLQREGVTTLEALSKVDVDRLSQDTGIPRNDLVELRSMAIHELLLMRELKDPR
jgi:hypothetical protein